MARAPPLIDHARSLDSFSGDCHSRGVKTIAAFLALAVAASAADMFPFQLPWDDASPSITNVSWLNDKPAGRDGFVSVKDGHLFAGEKRLRIFGVNMCFAANFPTHADADKVAARMAKFGINCVRFHHMDMFSAPAGIFAKDGRTLDAEQLDRLDYFIAALKKEGIYADLNLHVSRTYPDRPKAEKKGSPQFDKGVDNYHAPMIALQKDYARDLLSHVNKYTGNAYSAEPAVALVEINNENALGFQWFAGEMDNLPAPYAEDLSAQWTAWLVKKYGSQEKLNASWKKGEQPLGAELIDTDFDKQDLAWLLETHGGAEAKLEGGVYPAEEAVRILGGLPRNIWNSKDAISHATIAVSKTGSQNWHVQFNQSGIKMEKGTTCTVSFLAKAGADAAASISIGQAHEPWGVLWSRDLQLTSSWKQYSFTFVPKDGDPNARISFSGFGMSAGKYSIADVSLRPGGIIGVAANEKLGSIPFFKKAAISLRTQAAQRDWQEFIWDTETVYWNGMRDFLKKELGVKVPIVGTQGFWSPGHVQAGMDVIDSHAYWHHPQFEGGDWNPEKWTIKNEPMAGAKDGGTLPGLAAQRVAGKPFICTEYNHAAPNTYGAETAPLLAAFAALQDWDGIFLFAYSHNDKWSQEHFDSFFDIARHPVKMATLPGAAVSFRRDDIKHAPGAVFEAARVPALDRVLKGGPVKANPNAPSVVTGGPSLGLRQEYLPKGGTNETWPDIITWSVRPASWENGVASFRTVFHKDSRANDSEMSQMISGSADRTVFAIGKVPAAGRFDLGHFQITPGANRQNWASYQLTVMDVKDFATANRILITATGDIANTDMGWKNAEKTTVGRDWGKAPVLVEGPAAKIELPGGGKFKAWALDERGQRREEIPVVDGKLEIGPQFKTLWYEVERQ